MNIYLDIDGTILDSNLKPARHLKKFLEIALEKHNLFWLSSHCKGNSQSLIDYFSNFLEGDYIELFKRIKPTNWQTLKTEAIDFSNDFIWLDDYILEQEQKVLKEKGKLDSWVKIDLNNNPNQFLDIIKVIK